MTQVWNHTYMKSYSLPRIGGANPAVVRSALRQLVAVGIVATLAACAAPPSRPTGSTPAPAPAPAVVSMDEWMNRGDAALKEGDHVKARDAWRTAARDYPTAKQPWLKLSEDYFNAADYGNAVLAAQEALQRDPRDRTANSVLAVSGLRLTAGSLAALREDGSYPVGSRSEAVSVTMALREALGEPVLVPPPDSASKTKKPVARRAGRPNGAESADAPASPPPASPPPASGNPLNKLK